MVLSGRETAFDVVPGGSISGLLHPGHIEQRCTGDHRVHRKQGICAPTRTPESIGDHLDFTVYLLPGTAAR